MNDESLAASEPGSAGCSLKCSCLFVSALVSTNRVDVGSAQVMFMARWIAFTHLLSRTLQVLIHHPS